jgi:thiamine kinase-like enzyme
LLHFDHRKYAKLDIQKMGNEYKKLKKYFTGVTDETSRKFWRTSVAAHLDLYAPNVLVKEEKVVENESDNKVSDDNKAEDKSENKPEVVIPESKDSKILDMQFIDFEYSSPAPRGLDLANHFVGVPEGIFMEGEEFSPRKNFPKREFIEKWVNEY